MHGTKTKNNEKLENE